MKTATLSAIAVSAVIASAIMTGCNENDSVVGGPAGAFRLAPLETAYNMWVHAEQPPLALSVEGGEGPFAWSMTQPALGSLVDTNLPFGRSVTYTPTTGQEGLNRIRVIDRNQWEASAQIWQDTFSVSVEGSEQATPYATEVSASNAVLTITAAGGSTPLTWDVTDTNLGTVVQTPERISYYERKGITNGINLVNITDARGLEVTVSILQYTVVTNNVSTNSP